MSRAKNPKYKSMQLEELKANMEESRQELEAAIHNKNILEQGDVQEVGGWERVVNSLATDYDVDLYVTGSNSRMMSSEIATYLTGRYVSFRIYTLSFREYLDFKKQYAQLKDVHAELAEYIRLSLLRNQ